MLDATKGRLLENFYSLLVGTGIVLIGYLSSLEKIYAGNIFEVTVFGFLISLGFILLDEQSRKNEKNGDVENGKVNKRHENQLNQNLLVPGVLALLLAGLIAGIESTARLVYFGILIGFGASYFALRYRSVYSSILKGATIGMLVLTGSSFCCVSFDSFMVALLVALLFLGAEITWEIGMGNEKYRELSIPAYLGEKESGIIVSLIMLACILLVLVFSRITLNSILAYSVPVMIFAYCGYKMLIDAEKFANEVYLLQKISFALTAGVIIYPKLAAIVR